MDSASAEQGLEKSEAVGTQATSSAVCTAQLFANSAMSSVYSSTAWKYWKSTQEKKNKTVNKNSKDNLEISVVFQCVHCLTYRYDQSAGDVEKSHFSFLI